MRQIIIALLCWSTILSASATEVVRDQGFEVQIQPFPSTFLTRCAGAYGFEQAVAKLINVVVWKSRLMGKPVGRSRHLYWFLKESTGTNADTTFRGLMRAKMQSGTLLCG